MSAPTPPDPNEHPLRPHTYDGIQEFDKRLPNWWLFTLYGAMVFAFVYWVYFHDSRVGLSDKDVLARDMAALEELRLQSSLGALDDARLWDMSRQDKHVEAGRATFQANCAACHLASLRGKEENPAAVGPSLVDDVWIHGGAPLAVRATVANGVPDKGMLAWGPVLGDRKIVDVVAFVLSHHTPPAGPAAAPAP
jgi:cytochrome c oxidase cbb3-type subunit 3